MEENRFKRKNMVKLPCSIIAAALTNAVVFSAWAEEPTFNECLKKMLLEGDASLTLGEVRARCNANVPVKETAMTVEHNEPAPEDIERQRTSTQGLVEQRLARESETELDKFVITPHKQNYLLPAYATNAINKDAYSTLNGFEENLEDIEAMFQISVKAPLAPHNLLVEGDGLYMGFTLSAWWQVYADGISKPFRETNYQPEIFYVLPTGYELFGAHTTVLIGLEHQSNGRGQGLSRSWNRVYTNFLFEKDNWVVSFRPWIRLAEDEKRFEFDPDGDDNPDIEDFMGHFELGAAYRWNTLEFSFRGRQNFSTHYGAAEFAITFPLWGKFRGYAKAFHGYGDSLIDYNYSQTRVGLGFALNEIF